MESTSENKLEKLAFALVYATDLQKAIQFYKKYFAYKIDDSFKMSDQEVYGFMGNVGLWIGGGHKKPDGFSEKSTRATVMLQVTSVHELFHRLKKDSIKLYQTSPVQMQKDSWWFQFADQDENVIDILGGL